MINKSKLFLIVLIVFMALCVNSTHASDGAEYSDYIKVGLKWPLKSQESFKLRSEGGFVFGRLSNNFDEIGYINNEELDVTLDGSKKGPYHIILEEKSDSLEEVQKIIEKFKQSDIESFLYFDENINIGVGNYKSLEAAQKDYDIIKDYIGEATIINGSNKLINFIDSNGDSIILINKSSDIHFKAINENTYLQVEDRHYRDFLKVTSNNNKIIPVVVTDINNYLYGVVPREISASWPIEAVKAQAVAARNFTLYNLDRHSHEGYDLCDTVHCQVFGGVDYEKERSNIAVDETKNITIKYNGRIIPAYYHSNSGGQTANSENIWSAKVPYLRGVKDEFSVGAPNSNWTYNVSTRDLNDKLREEGIDIGSVVSIEPIEISENNRVVKLLVVGTNGKKVLEKEKIRRILGTSNLKSIWYKVKTNSDVYVIDGKNNKPMKASLTESSIITGRDVISNRSSNTINNIVNVISKDDKKRMNYTPEVFTFEGKGWGHGLGMSQWGAKKMAELGYTFEEILEHYYSGTIVE